jgi:hypothetical protein
MVIVLELHSKTTEGELVAVGVEVRIGVEVLLGVLVGMATRTNPVASTLGYPYKYEYRHVGHFLPIGCTIADPTMFYSVISFHITCIIRL